MTEFIFRIRENPVSGVPIARPVAPWQEFFDLALPMPVPLMDKAWIDQSRIGSINRLLLWLPPVVQEISDRSSM